MFVKNGEVTSATVIFLLLLPFLLVSCVTVPYQKIDSSLNEANYKEALNIAEESKGKGYKKKDALLYYLEAGMLAHYAKEFSKSTKLLNTAQQKIEASVTKSITREVSSFLINDRVKEYAGEDYESFYVNFFNSLNYFFLSSYESAMVEIRRLQNKVKHLKNKYGEDIRKAKEQIAQKNKDLSYQEKIKKSKFFDSALAQYLSLLFYRSQYLYDDMHLNAKAIEETFSKNKTIYNFPIPKSIEEEFHLKKGQARLNCFAFYGLSPIKKEEVLRLPIPPANWIKIALPKLVKRPSQVAKVELVLEKRKINDNDKSMKEHDEENEENEKKNEGEGNHELETKETIFQKKSFEPLEDISAVAMDTFQNRANLIYLKTILRSLAKSATAAVLTHQALQENNQQSSTDHNQEQENNQSNNSQNNNALLFGLLGVFAQAFAELSERADLRISRYFPGMAAIASVTVEPGVYDFTIYYYNREANILFRETFTQQEIKTGQLNICESYFLQ